MLTPNCSTDRWFDLFRATYFIQMSSIKNTCEQVSYTTTRLEEQCRLWSDNLLVSGQNGLNVKIISSHESEPVKTELLSFLWTLLARNAPSLSLIKNVIAIFRVRFSSTISKSNWMSYLINWRWFLTKLRLSVKIWMKRSALLTL